MIRKLTQQCELLGYITQRPISHFQGISFKLADMAVKVEAAKLLTQQAGELKNQGKNVTKESAMAKLYAADICVEVANEPSRRCCGMPLRPGT